MVVVIRSEFRGVFVSPALGLVLLSLGGCGSRDRADDAVKPQREEVEKITVTVIHPLVKGAAPCETVLSKGDEMAPLLDWRKGIDWSKGEDMAPMRLSEPDGHLVIHMKNGTEESLSWYWDGKVVSPRRNLLLRTNRTELQKVIQAACT